MVKKMTVKEYMNRKNEVKKPIFIHKIIVLLIVASLIIVIARNNENVSSFMNDKVFKNNINFAKLNNLYTKYVTNIFNKEEESIPVLKEEIINTYAPYKDGVEVINDEEEVTNNGSGIVIYVGEVEGYGLGVTIEQSDGIDVTYSNLESVEAKMYDYVLSGDIIGKKGESYYLTYKKNDEYLDYKDYIK